MFGQIKMWMSSWWLFFLQKKSNWVRTSWHFNESVVYFLALTLFDGTDSEALLLHNSCQKKSHFAFSDVSILPIMSKMHFWRRLSFWEEKQRWMWRRRRELDLFSYADAPFSCFLFWQWVHGYKTAELECSCQQLWTSVMGHKFQGQTIFWTYWNLRSLM